MKQTIEEVNIAKIRRDEALQLRNEILLATNGKLKFMPDKYPKLNVLFDMLSASFEHTIAGVHVVKEYQRDSQ